MATLISLPTELITLVGDYLTDKDLAHLAQAAQTFNNILSTILKERSYEDQPPPVVKISALIWAIHYGHTRLVRNIVSEPNFSRFSGGIQHALELAAELGHAKIIQLLISAGYSVEGSGSRSPLHLAAANGHAAAVTELLDHGADVYKKYNHKTALICAIQAPWELLEKMAGNGVSERDELELLQTIEAKVVTTIQVLLNRGGYAQLSVLDSHGDTPLHHAVIYCPHSTLDIRAGSGILNQLVQAGSSLTARNTHHDTPVDLAVEATAGSRTALTYFLDIGLSPNTKSFWGKSLLSTALCCDEAALPIIEILLAKGARAEDISLHPLFRESENPDPVVFDNILTLLLIHGATFGEDGSECFGYAALHGMLEIMKVILEMCPRIDINTTVEEIGMARVGTALQLAIGDDRGDIVEYLVGLGVEMSTEEKMQVDMMLN